MEEAIREMTERGFGFHEVYRNLPGWIEEMDIESVKKYAGITTGRGQLPRGDALTAAHAEDALFSSVNSRTFPLPFRIPECDRSVAELHWK